MRRSVALALVALVLLPGGVLAYQLAQVADSKGCPSHLVPSAGPLKLRVYTENAVQAASLDLRAFSAYLSDRVGRPVVIAGIEQTDETGFRLAAAQRPLGDELLLFFAYVPSFPNVPTAHGMVDALGFATPGTACAYISFLPTQGATLCRVGPSLQPLQPSYAYAVHEVGHLMGVSHTPRGIMGTGVFDLCSGDAFTAAQKSQLAAWGR